MSSAFKLSHFVSEQDYLAGEKISDIKYEYIDGKVYAMAGASRKHNLISNNIARELGNGLKQQKSSCQVFSSDMKVKINTVGTRFYYPDVMVTCDEDEGSDDYYTDTPKLIVEVLSSSTRKMDKAIKMRDYIQIPSLEEYVLIEQELCEVEVLRRHENWKPNVYFLGDEITLSSINITVTVADIYYQINNPEILAYLSR